RADSVAGRHPVRISMEERDMAQACTREDLVHTLFEFANRRARFEAALCRAEAVGPVYGRTVQGDALRLQKRDDSLGDRSDDRLVQWHRHSGIAPFTSGPV